MIIMAGVKVGASGRSLKVYEANGGEAV